MKPFVIAIAGGSASGKTTFVNELIKDTNSVVIHQDDYYKDQSHLSMEERYQTNYDHPDAFDELLLLEHIQLLKKGHSIDKPIYDFVNHNRSLKSEVVNSQNIIIIEGLFVLYDKDIRDECDLLIYVDCDEDIRIMRRIKRDMDERGRSLESIYMQYLSTVKPMYEKYILPNKRYADMIVLTHHDTSRVIQLLKEKINSVCISEN